MKGPKSRSDVLGGKQNNLIAPIGITTPAGQTEVALLNYHVSCPLR